MQQFIANENVKRFRQQLGNSPDEQRKETLEQLLAAEEGKLKELRRTRRQFPEPYRAV